MMKVGITACLACGSTKARSKLLGAIDRERQRKLSDSRMQAEADARAKHISADGKLRHPGISVLTQY